VRDGRDGFSTDEMILSLGINPMTLQLLRLPHRRYSAPSALQ
jgi:hypothetical protein